MTLKLDLSPEQEAALRETAARQGTDEQEAAVRLLGQALGVSAPEPEARLFYETATTEEWIAAFDAWVNSHDPNGPFLLDDRREIIYED
jgi:hypothetical protein